MIEALIAYGIVIGFVCIMAYKPEKGGEQE